MRARTAALAAVTALGVLALSAAPPPAAGEMTLALRSPAAPDGPALRLVAEGRTFSPPLDLAAEGAPADVAATLGFLRRVVRANASGDKAEMVALFPAAEREATAALADEAGVLEKNAAAFRAFLASRLLAEFRYGPVVYLAVEHDLEGGRRFVQLYPTVVEGEATRLTNALVGDPNAEMLRQAFARADFAPLETSGSLKP